MKYLIIFIFSFCMSKATAQNVEIINYDELEQKWSKNNDTLYLINYWATWCVPCVEELPDFLKLEQEMKSQKFKMILVSLDFPSHVDKRVMPFIEKNSISTEVVILDDDPNVWIDKVDNKWDGAIPVTQFIKNGKKYFYGEQLDYHRLKNIVQIINN